MATIDDIGQPGVPLGGPPALIDWQAAVRDTLTVLTGVVTPAAGWSDYGATFPLTLTRHGSLVNLTGLFKRTGADLAVSVGVLYPLGTLPVGFRPPTTIPVTAGWGPQGLGFGKVYILSDGLVQFAPAVAGTVSANGIVLAPATYKGA